MSIVLGLEAVSCENERMQAGRICTLPLLLLHAVVNSLPLHTIE